MVDLDLLLAIIPKIGASFSIPSSLFIIAESIGDHRKGKGTAIQRALVGMSVVDVFASSAWFLSTWALPEGTAPLSRGNMATCNFQGFLLQLAIGAPLYNCSLALYYVLVIRYNWTNKQLLKIEPFIHAGILTFTIGTSILGLPMTMYNKVGTVCWVIGSPPDCGHSSSTPSDIPCDRGDHAWLFGISLFYGPLWICVLLTIIAMGAIYIQVRNTFRKSEQYSARQQEQRAADRASFQATHQTVTSDFTSVRCTNSEFVYPSRASELSQSFNLTTSEAPFTTSVSNHQQPLKVIKDIEVDDDNDNDVDIEDDDELDNSELSGPISATSKTTGVLENPTVVSFRPRHRESEDSVGIGLVSGWKNAQAVREELEEEWETNVITPRQQQPTTPMARRSTSTVSRSRQKQNVFALQAILYSGSFFITWTPSTIWSVAYWFGIGGIGFDIAAASCEPLQGFWNMLIFVRGRKNSREKLGNIFGCLCNVCMSMLPNLSEPSLHSSHVRSDFNDGTLGPNRSTNHSIRASKDRDSQFSTRAERAPESEFEAANRKSAQVDTDPSTGDSL